MRRGRRSKKLGRVSRGGGGGGCGRQLWPRFCWERPARGAFWLYTNQQKAQEAALEQAKAQAEAEAEKLKQEEAAREQERQQAAQAQSVSKNWFSDLRPTGANPVDPS